MHDPLVVALDKFAQDNPGTRLTDVRLRDHIRPMTNSEADTIKAVREYRRLQDFAKAKGQYGWFLALDMKNALELSARDAKAKRVMDANAQAEKDRKKAALLKQVMAAKKVAEDRNYVLKVQKELVGFASRRPVGG